MCHGIVKMSRFSVLSTVLAGVWNVQQKGRDNIFLAMEPIPFVDKILGVARKTIFLAMEPIPFVTIFLCRLRRTAYHDLWSRELCLWSSELCLWSWELCLWSSELCPWSAQARSQHLGNRGTKLNVYRVHIK